MGKTTCAAALGFFQAHHHSRRTLVVSTDPAPSLGDALKQPLSGTARAVPGTSGLLYAAEIDAAAAMARWLRRRRSTLERIALRGTWLDEEDIAALLRQTLPGLDELAALFEILRFVRCDRYDLLLLDTAPTGHTLRLLALPETLGGTARALEHMQARHRAVVDALRGHWSRDDADALIGELDEDARELRTMLQDPARTQVSWVTLPEALAVAETEDGLRALRAFALPVTEVIVNRVTPPARGPCRWCSGRRAEEWRQVKALERLVDRGFETGSRPTLVCVDAQETEPVGPAALRRFARLLRRRDRPASSRSIRPSAPGTLLAEGIRGAAWDPPVGSATRLVILGGKGGVGKTTCAAAIALEAARSRDPGRVLLVSTDPAHSLGDVLSVALSDIPQRIPGGPRNLEARELNASGALRKLRATFTTAIGGIFERLDRDAVEASYDRRILQDLVDLAPPGLDEIAAILEVVALAAPGRAAGCRLIVMDTAPTGHALRLLEMPELLQRWVHALMRIVLKYQPVIGAGDLGRPLLGLSKRLSNLRVMLADGRHTQFLVVTRTGRLPRAEAVRLVSRLRRLRIPVSAVIVNATGAGTCRRCCRAVRREGRELEALRRAIRGPAVVLAPASVPPPRGSRPLTRWRAAWRCR